MIDLAKEKILTLEQAAERLLVSKASIYRWITHGTDNVRLEAAKVGSVWRTSEEAIQRFSDALTEAHLPSNQLSPAPKPRSLTEKQREKHHEQVEKEIDALMGITRCDECRNHIDPVFVDLQPGAFHLCPTCVLAKPNQPFGLRLRACRLLKGMRQQDLSEHSGVSVLKIRDLERGILVEPKPEDLERLAGVLGPTLLQTG